ncbi:hypothetical protein WICPIJ_003517 [Wickerhamomyces pijperi]|uniref:Uncharacterized protein n=1 Tax=Wickerhamomyces pijperi TaxID=599730 RepID=A0A9P8Q7I1_WICPI|nr:hypothetical protein WICPIJ_003517 [Wickerhamomyces pijperi]
MLENLSNVFLDVWLEVDINVGATLFLPFLITTLFNLASCGCNGRRVFGELTVLGELTFGAGGCLGESPDLGCSNLINASKCLSLCVFKYSLALSSNNN